MCKDILKPLKNIPYKHKNLINTKCWYHGHILLKAYYKEQYSKLIYESDYKILMGFRYRQRQNDSTPKDVICLGNLFWTPHLYGAYFEDAFVAVWLVNRSTSPFPVSYGPLPRCGKSIDGKPVLFFFPGCSDF